MPPPGAVLVVGDVMNDTIVRPEGPLLRGTDRRATIRSHPGGSGANQAAWLAHFGVPTTFVARVGAADLPAISQAFRAAGVVPRLGADPGLPTGAVVTLLDLDGERSFLTDRGANDALGADDLPDDLLDGAAWLHLSGYALVAPGPRAAVLDLIERARARGARVSVDPASTAFLEEVGPAAFLRWTDGADLCVPNEAEAALLADATDPARQHAVLGARYGCTVVKRGAAGATMTRGGEVLSLPAPAVSAVDTTGAGDAFLSRFLAGALAGEPDEAALAAAIAAGADAVTTFGGRPRPARGGRDDRGRRPDAVSAPR